jgi:hypothetical protein
MRRLSVCYEQRTEIFRQFFILAFGHRIGQALSRVQREQCSRDSGWKGV